MKNTSFLKKLLTRIVLADILTIVPVRGYSSAGRALDWQSRGQRFDPAYLHQNKKDTDFGVFFVFCGVTERSAARRA